MSKKQKTCDIVKESNNSAEAASSAQKPALPNKILYSVLVIAVIALAIMSVMLISGYVSNDAPSVPAVSPIQSETDKKGKTPETEVTLSPEATDTETTAGPVYTPPKYTIADTLCLDVKNISQLPSLPNGCEVTSLAIVLNYLGYDIDPITLFYDHMPYTEYDYGDPWTSYIGDPTGLGLGCYAPCVVTAGNSYLKQNGNEYITQDVSYKAFENYKLYLNLGYPVIFWGMLDMNWNPSIAWGSYANGQEVIWHAFSHCLVLIGYTEDEFIFCDPLKGIEYYKQSAVADCFTTMFKQACVITEHDVDLDLIFEEYEEEKNKIPPETTGPAETTGRPKDDDNDGPDNPYDDIDIPQETNAPEETTAEETLPDIEDEFPDDDSELDDPYDDVDIPQETNEPEETKDYVDETLEPPEEETIEPDMTEDFE